MKPGTRIGRYEILEQLGAGGMGEVWLAIDRDLDRKVAIKVLPATVGDNPQGLARLEQEARILAQLEHPNVAGVYGLERIETDGAGSSLHLVMQYAEGETLADRLTEGALSVEDALEIAGQVAAGLGAAHDGGIVHRDLKPANIMLSEGSAGTVQAKVLDFGLAKAGAGEGAMGSGDLSASPTHAAVTADGMIMGTAAYMSPEQARGKATDRRTDVWAFGCVLYEMLTGDQAFPGETVSDVMAGILKEEPDWSNLPPALPSGVRRGLRLCLNKNPPRRPYDVRDVILSFGPGEDDEEAPEVVRNTPARPVLPVVAVTLIVGLAVGYLLASQFQDEPAATVQPSSYRQMTTTPGVEDSPSLSGDGEWIVYTSRADGDADIYLLGVGGSNPINLTASEPADDVAPAFSPDGRSIAFRSERGGGGIFVMGRTGESVRRVSEEGHNPAWSPDGSRIVVATEAIADSPLTRESTSRLIVIDPDSSESIPLETGDAVQPAWSHDGRRIVYWGLPEGSGQRDLWTVALDGSAPVRLTEDAATDWTPVWSVDDRHVIFSSDRAGTMGLWRISVDPETGGPAGTPEPIAAGAGDLWLSYPTVSEDGRSLLYSATRRNLDAFRIYLSDDLRNVVRGPERLTNSSRAVVHAQLSPDGTMLAYASGWGDQEDLFVQPLDGSPLVRLTNDPAKDRRPRFSPDGRWLNFYTDRSGTYQSHVIAIDGSGLRPMVAAGRETRVAVWSPDGERLAMTLREEGLPLLIRPFRSDDPAEVVEVNLAVPPDTETTPSDWSPDGRFIVLHLTGLSDGAVRGSMVLELETGETRRVTDFGEYPVFFPDSRHIAFRSGREIFVADTETLEAWAVFDANPDGLGFYPSIHWEDNSIVYSQLERHGDVWLAEY